MMLSRSASLQNWERRHRALEMEIAEAHTLIRVDPTISRSFP